MYIRTTLRAKEIYRGVLQYTVYKVSYYDNALFKSVNK